MGLTWEDPYLGIDGMGGRDARAPVEETVLVAIVPNLQDWDLVLDQGWYRIPLERAPQRIAADYVAFYHPKVFDELRWTITYYAEVRRYALLPRRELLPDQADHPRADALYYRIDLGPLQRLGQPIVSRNLRRVTFIHTTLSRLLGAQEIGELWGHEPPNARWERVRRLGEAPCLA
jgi:hypothetical protein